ncbi:MAG TPA: phage tail tape measure protein [Jiangellaceae bacterium]|nr:phage tail tape measure protein [Jiangellaceae bacterium]
MAKTDLKVTIDAEAAKLERAIDRAVSSMQRLEGQIRRTDLAAAQLDKMLEDRRAQALEKLGRGMVAFGAATVAGLGIAVKAAIDWESAWAGVRKTVEGSPEELAAVESGLRDLATTLPASHREIAAVAEAAGQLGVATGDVVGFTRVMIDLGETTNLSADEAATSIAQLMNVMQTAPQDVGRLGAALVELGNNGASTERDIIQMAQRIAGAGAIIGLSEADVLAFGNALASVGIEAEAGGSAISRVMINIAGAVAEGGEAVAGFARVAGMSAGQFTEAFEKDPARAIQAFVSGLGQIDAAGGNVFATLDELGLSEIRVRDALLRLAGAGDLLQQSLNDGARAWQENTALIEEATKRYDTAEAKIQIAKNAVVDFGIDVGSVLLPAIASLAEGVADIAQFFGDLPGPVRAVATIFAALVGAASLLGGGFLLLAPRIVAAQAAMLTLARTAPVMYGAMAYTGQFLGLLGALAAVAAAFAFLKQTAGDTDIGVGRATKAIVDLERGVSNELINKLGELEGKLNDADRILGIIPTSLGGFAMSGKQAAEVTNEYRATVEALDQALAHMVASGQADQAASAAKKLADQFGITTDDLPVYVDALAAADAGQGTAAESAGGLAAELQAEAAAIEAAQEALDAYLEDLRAATDPVFAVVSALEGVQTAQSAYNEAVKEHGKNSEEAKAASIGLAEAVAGMEAAVLDGDLSWENFDATLDRWVQQGVITAGQAETIRDSVNEAKGAADDYAGDYQAQLKLARDKAAERAAQRDLDRIAAARRARLMANLTGQAGVESALNRLAQPRTARITVTYAVSGGIPAGLTRGHSGGLVTGAGIIPRFHEGASLAGLAAGEIPAILQTGERVLSRSQNAVFSQLSSLLTRIAVTPSPRLEQRGSTIDPHLLSRLIGQEVGAQINGATIIIDDQGRGRMIARQSALYARAG